VEVYLFRQRPSPSPLLSPDVLADVDVADLKLSILRPVNEYTGCLKKNATEIQS
jgi:hypothetical protein